MLLSRDVTGGTEKHVRNQELSNEGIKVRHNPKLLLDMYLCAMLKITAVRKLILNYESSETFWVFWNIQGPPYSSIFFTSLLWECQNIKPVLRIGDLEQNL